MKITNFKITIKQNDEFMKNGDKTFHKTKQMKLNLKCTSIIWDKNTIKIRGAMCKY